MERVERYESYVNREQAKEELMAAIVNCRETSQNIDVFYRFDYLANGKYLMQLPRIQTYINYLIINHETGETIAKSSKNAVLERNYYLLTSFNFNKQNIVVYVQDKTLAFSFTETMILFCLVIALFVICVIALIIIVVILFKRKEDDIMRDHFFHNITHELKTPVTTIAIANERLKKIAEKEDLKAIKMTQIIEDENSKIRVLVDHILRFASLERDIIDISKEEVHIHQALKEVLNDFKLIFETKGVCVETKIEAKNDLIEGNLTFIKILFSNLIDNAVKYSQGTPDISIKTSSTDNQIVVLIADQGIGIAKKNLKKVFKKMYRVKNQNSIKGFGLGLFFVKQIVSHFNGTILVQSELGKGTTFILTFPLIVDEFLVQNERMKN